ncbi:MAG: hypothetical protein PHW77_08490 [Eubacteriales bacterium]|nr:hypothetical protein [Eubacteriales bacterium]
MDSCIKSEKTLKKEYKDESGKPVMLVNISVPVLSGDELFKANSEKLYGGIFDGFLSYCEKKLYKKAIKESAGEEFNPRGGVLKYTVSFENDLFFSAFIDASVFDGKTRSKVARLSQVWSKKEGRLLNFYDFFNRADRERLLSLIASEVKNKRTSGISEYKKGVENLLESCADFSRFYLVPGGYAFYYAPGELSDSRLPEVFITGFKSEKITAK